MVSVSTALPAGVCRLRDGLHRFLADENKTLLICTIFALVMFFPMGTFPDYDQHFRTIAGENGLYTTNVFFLMSVVTIPVVVVPTAMDALTDLALDAAALHRSRNSRRTGGDRQQQSLELGDHGAVKVTRLTVVERLLFVVGVSLQPVIVLSCAPFLGHAHMQALYECSTNFKLILTFAPMMSFLQRCTTTFTPLTSFFIMFTLCVALLLNNVSWSYPIGSDQRAKLNDVVNAICYAVTLIFFASCATCLWKYCLAVLRRRRADTGTRVRGHGQTNSNSDTSSRKSAAAMATAAGSPSASASSSTDTAVVHGQLDDKIRQIDDFYANSVPAAHMLSCTLLIASAALPETGVFDDTDPRLFELRASCNYIMLALVALIVFIEQRVRANEVERTLLRTISAVKKSYVRYLSHELRTPLNTVWLGTQLLGYDLQQKQGSQGRQPRPGREVEDGDLVAVEEEDGEEVEREEAARLEERWEILKGMSAACKSAVDLLDDMIQFDRLESGIMTLVRQPVAVAALLTECCAVYGAEARHGRVIVQVCLDSEPAVLRLLPDVYAAMLHTSEASRLPPPHAVSALPALPALSVSRIRDVDMINVDRQKIASVLASLVSAVLKATPAHGTLKVSAWFVPDADAAAATGADGSGTNRSASVSSRVYESLTSRSQRRSVTGVLDLGETGSARRDTAASVRSSVVRALSLATRLRRSSTSTQRRKRTYVEVTDSPAVLPADAADAATATATPTAAAVGTAARAVPVPVPALAMGSLPVPVSSPARGRGLRSSWSMEAALATARRGGAALPGAERGRLVVVITDVDSEGDVDVDAVPAGVSHTQLETQSGVAMGTGTGTGTSDGAPLRPVTTTAPAPRRVAQEILHFNPHQLIAGGGDGMNLWISRGVVELHGGTLRLFTDSPAVDSGSGSGSGSGEALGAVAAAGGGDGNASASSAAATGATTRERKTFVLEIPMYVDAARATAPVAAAAAAADGSASSPALPPAVAPPSVSATVSEPPPRGVADNRIARTASRDSSNVDSSVSDPERLRGRLPADARRLSLAPTPQADPLIEEVTAREPRTTGLPGPVAGPTATATATATATVTRPAAHGAASTASGEAPNPTEGGLGAEAPSRGQARAEGQLLYHGQKRVQGQGHLPQPQPQPGQGQGHQPGQGQGQRQGHGHGQGQGQGQGHGRRLVLVVDDSDLTRKMLCRMMRAHGYDCEEAEDGLVAVECVRRNLALAEAQAAGSSASDTERSGARSEAGIGSASASASASGPSRLRPYAVVLMDFVMPRMDGPSATREIRALGYGGPVLGVTGNGQEFDVLKLLESGADKVFTKPLDMAAFSEFMRQTDGPGADSSPPT